MRGLDWANFFIANLQTSFGPFLAVYLTSRGWSQVAIGTALSVGSLMALASQLPGGALVDAIADKRSLAAAASLSIALSGLILALSTSPLAVFSAEILHGFASALLGPAIAAISLGLVGHRHIGERLGRNARFASVGNGIAAAVMGACGYYISAVAVFVLTAALGVPMLLSLFSIRAAEIDPIEARGGRVHDRGSLLAGLTALLQNRSLVAFTLGCAFFQMANAAMLPLMGGILTARSSRWAIVLIAASLILPQLIVALLAPWIGRSAERRGRKPLLLLGLGTLPVRGLLFAVFHSPYLLVATQLLDGVSAAVFGVMSPLVVADLSRGTGHFNLAQGLVGTAIGIGASLSTTLGGEIADRAGTSAAFLSLAAFAVVALVIVWRGMAECRPDLPEPPVPSDARGTQRDAAISPAQ